MLYILFVILAVLCGVSYLPSRDIMITGNTWLYIIESNITLNFVLFLSAWGLMCDHYTKNMSRKKGWIVWAISMIFLILFFKVVGGYPTIIG